LDVGSANEWGCSKIVRLVVPQYRLSFACQKGKNQARHEACMGHDVASCLVDHETVPVSLLYLNNVQCAYGTVRCYICFHRLYKAMESFLCVWAKLPRPIVKMLHHAGFLCSVRHADYVCANENPGTVSQIKHQAIIFLTTSEGSQSESANLDITTNSNFVATEISNETWV
jgi:hypothetical protein